jgi:outer membrane protein assembly factor BamB
MISTSRVAWIVVSLAANPLLVAHAADWPQWRGPNRDGISAETNWDAKWPAAGPKVLWKLSVGIGASSMSISQGRLYTVGNINDNDIVYCLDAETGKEIWRHSYRCTLDPRQFEGGPAATPTVDGNRVYTLSHEGDLFCLDAASGKLVWSKDLRKDFAGRRPQWGYAGSPLVVDNLLIVDAGGRGCSTIALDKTTGKLIWQDGGDQASYAAPVRFEHGGKKCLALFNAYGLVIREVTTGSEISRHRWKTSYDVNAATPIIAGDRIFIASGYSKGGALLQLASDEFRVLWQTKNMRSQLPSPVLWKGNLYGFDEHMLTCLDFDTGEVRWQQPGLGQGTLIVAGGKLIVLSESGELVIANALPAAFNEIARARLLHGRCWVAPALANGRLYVKDNRGELVCVDVRPETKPTATAR